MPAKNTRPSRLKIPSSPFGRLMLVIFAILVAMTLTMVGLKIRHDRLIAADRARFARAEKEVEEVSNNITAQIGQPLRQDKKKSCSRPSMKFNEGPLSCNIDYQKFYLLENYTDANILQRKLNDDLILKWQHEKTTYSPNLANSRIFELQSNGVESDLYNEQKIYQDYIIAPIKMPCTVVYELYNAALPPYPDYVVATSHKLIMSFSISCGDYAKSQHYPSAN